MDRPILKTEKREISGRKVKKLRRNGVLPGNVYGKNTKSLALQMPLKEFLSVYEKVGETGLVDLVILSKGQSVSGEDKEVRPVLIANVQPDSVSDIILHVDFRQVDLKEKIQAPVPVELTGEAPAEKSGVGILVQQLNEIEVEALPTDLPGKLIADVSSLENIDDAILVKDLSLDSSKVTLLVDERQIVAKIEPPAKEEEVAPLTVEEGAEVSVAEGEVEVPTTGEAPAGSVASKEEGEVTRKPEKQKG